MSITKFRGDVLPCRIRTSFRLFVVRRLARGRYTRGFFELSGFQGQIQQQGGKDERDQANHEHHVVARSQFTGHQIICHDGLFDFSQMPEHVNKSADHGDEGNSGNDTDG